MPLGDPPKDEQDRHSDDAAVLEVREDEANVVVEHPSREQGRGEDRGIGDNIDNVAHVLKDSQRRGQSLAYC